MLTMSCMPILLPWSMKAAGCSIWVGGRKLLTGRFLKRFRKTVGATREPVFDQKRPGEIDHTCLDTTRVRVEMKWQPHVAFCDGVNRVVEFWKQELEHFAS